jgi:uncharacterized protein YidB (DUF937 family)
MGLLDQIEGALSGGGHAGPGGLSDAVHDLLASPQSGGLNGLVGRFAAAGLGSKVQSWIGTGPNQPVSEDEVHQALGQQQVQELSNRTGMSTSQLLPLLAQFLPMIIDRLTPNGRVPEALQGSGAAPAAR